MNQEDVFQAINAGDYERASELLLGIPDKVRTNIIRMLPIRDIISVFQVNAQLKTWSKSDSSIWLMLYERNFPELSLAQLRGILQVILKQAEIDISHNSYQSILFAYAALSDITNTGAVVTMNQKEFGYMLYMVTVSGLHKTTIFNTHIDTFDPSLMGFMRSLFKNTFVHGKKFDNRGVRLDAIWLIPTDPPHILFYKRIYFVYILLTQGWIIEPDNLNTIRGNCQQCGSPDVTLKCSEASCNVLYCSQECASTH